MPRAQKLPARGGRNPTEDTCQEDDPDHRDLNAGGADGRRKRKPSQDADQYRYGQHSHIPPYYAARPLHEGTSSTRPIRRAVTRP